MPTYPPRSWEIDDLFDLGRREKGRADYLKAIPVLILETWVTGKRVEGSANYFRTKWARRRIEESGLHDVFVGKGTSQILAALSVIQISRKLTPPLISNQNGVGTVNLPYYEVLLQEYREMYCRRYPSDYRKLYPHPDKEPVWKSLESLPALAKHVETPAVVVEPALLPANVATPGAAVSKYPTVLQVLEAYDKQWQQRLDAVEKRANAAEQEIAELKMQLSQRQVELPGISDRALSIGTDSAEDCRPRILEEIRMKVWRRDRGECARCGSRENLEYDHIIPLLRGGSNTMRNIELRCEKCNRSKGANIGG